MRPRRPSARGDATVGVSPARRLTACAAGGALTAAVVAVVGPWWLIPLAGWDAAAASPGPAVAPIGGLRLLLRAMVRSLRRLLSKRGAA